jgi:diadenosine tetraphosphate (Ap4A) HIT family hydrolase
MGPPDCLFCDRSNAQKHRIIAENELFYARYDNHPVTKGHSQIVPKRHIISFFDISAEDLRQMHDLLIKTKKILDERFHPDAYNIGINDGEAAGRTIGHLHVHLIPRYKGDVADPRGGVRHIIPGKGFY